MKNQKNAHLQSGSHRETGIRSVMILIAAALMLTTACEGPFSLNTALGLELETLSIAPNNVTLSSAGTQDFTVTGGVGPFEWNVISGPGSFVTSTGSTTETYDPGGVEGIATLEVKDAEGYLGYALVTVDDGVGPVTILPGTTSLDIGDAITLYAVGGDGNYSWSIDTDGSVGASISSGGGYYQPGVSAGTDVIRVTDGQSDFDTVNITVTDPTATLDLLAGATSLYTLDSLTLFATGGVPPYSFAILTPGSGTPSVTSPGGVYTAGTLAGTDVIEVTDSDTPTPSTATVNIDITVEPVIPQDIDFDITILNVPGTVTVGDAMSGVNFDYQNIGTDSAGGADVTWKAYISSTPGLDGDVSYLGTGTINDESDNIDFNSLGYFWPSTGGTYYIIIHLTTETDTDTTNNDQVSIAVTVDPLNIDYIGDSVPVGGTTHMVGDLLNETFVIANPPAGDTGTLDISWTAWISTDTTAGNTGDYQIASGNTGFIASGDTRNIAVSGNLNISPGAAYNLLLTWDAVEDINPVNNQSQASNTYTVIERNVDYELLTRPTGGVTVVAGDAITTESFAIWNSGIHDGTSDLTWHAWASLNDAILNAGDLQIDSGTVAGGLSSLANTGLIDIDTAWPDEPGDYHIIVTWSALDDNVDTNDSMTTENISTVDPPVHDFRVYNVVQPGPGAAGGTASGSFWVENQGPDNDTAHGFTYAVYASPDTTFDAGDALIDEGPGGYYLNVSASGQVIYSGNWPDIAGNYYIIAVIDSPYDDDASDNEAFDAAGPVTVSNIIDYEISSISYHPVGDPGAVLDSSIMTPLVSAPTPYEFNINMAAGSEGTVNVDYAVYASTDQILDAGDWEIKSGFVDPDDFDATSNVDVTYDDQNPWPATPSAYYIIASIGSADDMNPDNNIAVAGPVYVTQRIMETEPNDDPVVFIDLVTFILPVDFTDVPPVLIPGEAVRLYGDMDAYGEYDTYRMALDPSIGVVEVVVEWDTNIDDIDFYFWDDNGKEILSERTTQNSEGPMSVPINTALSSEIYIGVYFWLNGGGSGNEGAPYSVSIRGLP